MEKVKLGPLDVWHFALLKNEPSIQHFVTERHSNGVAPEFTLSLSSSPDKNLVQQNRAEVASALNIPAHHFFLPAQVHLTNIVQVTQHTTMQDVQDTDALITKERNVCIGVMSADCVTILLYDKRNGAIGAVHAGWKGTVAKILAKTLREMHNVFGTRGADLVAGIGPSVCQASYEVGGEVVAHVNEAFGADNDLLIPLHEGKAKLDLWKANKIQLLEFGVADHAIEVSNLCTVINNSTFFSARKGDSGRFAACIMLR